MALKCTRVGPNMWKKLWVGGQVVCMIVLGNPRFTHAQMCMTYMYTYMYVHEEYT